MPTHHFLPLRAVRPAGWIAAFLQTQAAGLTGHPEAQGYPYGQSFWGRANDDTGPYAAWWPYEQTAYWLDGALKCGFLCGDQALYGRALAEIEAALAGAAADGFIGPACLRSKDRWPYAVFFRAVLAQYEITGDPRYLDALGRHYRASPQPPGGESPDRGPATAEMTTEGVDWGMLHPLGWDRDASGVEILALLYQHTGDPGFRQGAEALYSRFNATFPDHDCALRTLRSDKPATAHGVTFNELAKLPAVLCSISENPAYRQAVVHGYAKIDRHQLLADGLHSCTERLRGRDALDSHETCDISDYTWALGYLLQITGDAAYADRIEKVIFNALPGAVTKDFRALQYFSCPNQVIATHTSNHNRFQRGFNWMSYRPDHEVQCCPGNVHRAMPNYVARQWLVGGEAEIVAALYGPGRVETTLAGVPVTITAETAYPAEQGITFDIRPARPAHFTFTVRIPGWCRRASLSVNGQPLDLPAPLAAGTFVPITRAWQPGDRLRLELPFELALQRFPRRGISIDYGPLVMSLPVAAHAAVEAGDSTNDQRRDVQAELYTPRPKGATADFPAWELTPASRWNYALCVDEESLPRLAQVCWHSPAETPFDPDRPAVTVRVPARAVAGWELERRREIRQESYFVSRGKWRLGRRRLTGDFAFTPPLPAPRGLKSRLSGEVEWLELVPYGATLLRLTVFPQAAG